MSKIKYATLSLSDDQPQQQQQQQIYQTVLQTNDCNNKNVQNNQNRNSFEICSISLDTTNTNSTTTLSSTAITTANSYLNDASFSFINTPVINDVFTQEANFTVPIMNKTWSTTTTTTTQQIIDTSNTLTPPIFTVPQNVCIKPTFDDDATHWHGSTDLLELDHRYNSCLQNDLLQTDNPSSVIVNTDNQEAEAMSELSEFMVTSGKGVIRQEVILTTHKSVQNHFSSELQQANRVSSDSESDFEDRNLSWLLNFKFDEFPHLSPDAATLNSKNKINFNMTNLNLNSTNKNLRKPNMAGSPSLDCSITQVSTQMPESSSKKKFEELVLEATSDMDCTENIENDNPVLDDMSYRMGKKPPFTYTELIEYALEDKGELTVSGIYQWISDRFPYYKSNDDRWKNSVRHNLSINPHFRKGAKASQGAGHLWTISNGDTAESVLAWEHKKQRLELFFKMESANLKRIKQHQLKQQKQEKQQQQQCNEELVMTSNNTVPQREVEKASEHFEDEAASAADIISREMLQQNDTNCSQRHTNLTNEHMQNMNTTTHFVHELPFNDLICEEELRRAAGQILNGIHREVEVQSVHTIDNSYQNVLLENEYLCGTVLQHADFNPNDGSHDYNSHNQHMNLSSQFNLDPMELDIQMSHQVENEEILFNEELGLNFFGYNVNSDIAT